MTDILTPAQRSALMARVRGSGNASTELRLVAVFRVTSPRSAKALRAPAPRLRRAGASATSVKAPPLVAERGTRFAPPAKPFQVRPDFVFPARKLAVFVDGCFWHGCPLHATQPKQNAKFWSEKIAQNQARDRLVTRTLRAKGWRVVRFWDGARQRGDGRAVFGAAPQAAPAAEGVSTAGRPSGGAAHSTN